MPLPKVGHILPLGFGAFSIFAVLACLVLLADANLVAPGCTATKVERRLLLPRALGASDSDAG